jgi:hypothetical protein
MSLVFGATTQVVAIWVVAIGDAMDSSGTCPHGHPLAEDAVYCTVCWVRVEPQDPAVEIARRRRARRIWIPFLAVSALLVGVAIGGVLGMRSVGYTPSFVAQEFPTLAQPAEAADASSDSEPVAVAAAPLAATILDTSQASEDCVALILEQAVPCALDSDGLALAVCAPDGTVLIKVSSRETKADAWRDAPSQFAVGRGDNCDPPAVTAELLIAAADTDASAWRTVGHGVDGQKLWSSRLVVSTGS